MGKTNKKQQAADRNDFSGEAKLPCVAWDADLFPLPTEENVPLY